MATTTSVANTGLLDYLIEHFTKETGIEVQYIAAGTGRALEHGRAGDVDLLLVHAPDAEKRFVEEGYGVERVPVAWNDFVIVGPPEDPAGLRRASSAAEAFKLIAGKRLRFASRGDNSGTHMREKAIWAAAGVEPGGSWYIETGSGMAATLRVADEKRAYALTDRGTFYALEGEIDLAIAFEGDSLLLNPYSLIPINPKRWGHVHVREAERFCRWLASDRGQALIGAYEVGGRRLFHPASEPVE